MRTLNGQQSGGKPKARYKSFRYGTELEWREARTGILGSPGKRDLRVSSPPEFKGQAGLWTPEDLFVAAVESCTMTTFLALADRARLPLVSYRSTAEGLLEHSGGGFQMTEIVVRPEVRIEKATSRHEVERLLEEAHRRCLIARSIRSRVKVEPTIQVDGDSPAPL